MKDWLHNQLELNDTVILIVPGYRMLVKGKIVGFTPKKVRISYVNNWNYGSPGHTMEILQDPYQIVRYMP